MLQHDNPGVVQLSLPPPAPAETFSGVICHNFQSYSSCRDAYKSNEPCKSFQHARASCVHVGNAPSSISSSYDLQPISVYDACN